VDALKRVEKAIVVAAPEVPGLVAFVVVRVARAKKAAADRPKKDVAVLAKKVEPAKRVERAKRVDVLKRADPSRSNFHSSATTLYGLSDPNSRKPRPCMAGLFSFLLLLIGRHLLPLTNNLAIS
jgi:hypothetical protein